MAFRFRLEALLRLQRGIEHQEENRLLGCVARIAGLKQELHDWEEERTQRQDSLCAELAQGSPASVMQFAGVWEQRVCALEKELTHQLQLAEQVRERQLQVYREARRKRETLESLREHGNIAYSKQQLRGVQQELDETHLLKTFRHEEG